MAKIEVELSNDTLFDAIVQTQFNDSEKLQILKALFPQRGFSDKTRMLGEVSEFVLNNM